MKNLIALFVFSFLYSTVSYAHVQIGNYQGVDAKGTICGFTATSVTFVDGVKHPLHERIEILVDGKTFVLQHLPQINIEKAEVGFDHGKLTGTQGGPESAIGVTLEMEHSETHDGPSVLNVVTQNYKDAALSTVSKCDQLKFTGSSN